MMAKVINNYQKETICMLKVFKVFALEED